MGIFSTKLRNYKNVHYEKNSKYPFSQLNESEFIESVIRNLAELMEKDFHKFDFFIYSNHGPAHPPPDSLNHTSSREKVLLYLSDEVGKKPEMPKEKYFAVFKAYVGMEDESQMIFPLPLGCVNDVPVLPFVPINERKFNVFFSGHLNSNRVAFYKSFASKRSTRLSYGLPNKILSSKAIIKLLLTLKSDFSQRFPDSLVTFNNKFKSGMSPSEYGTVLSQSKIVLCPKGSSSAECFRHFESIRAGCIVISEKLPDNYLYKDAPIIQVDNWHKGLEIVDDLLKDKEKLARLQHESINWWKNVFSERATANYIYTRLNRTSSSQSTPAHSQS